MGDSNGSIFAGDARLPAKDVLRRKVWQRLDINHDGMLSFVELKPLLTGAFLKSTDSFGDGSVKGGIVDVVDNSVKYVASSVKVKEPFFAIKLGLLSCYCLEHTVDKGSTEI